MSSKQADPPSGVTTRGKQFVASLPEPQHARLLGWLERVEQTTRFTKLDALVVCALLDDYDLTAETIVESVAPIAAYAHAEYDPIEDVADEVGRCLNALERASSDEERVMALLDFAEGLTRRGDRR